MKHKADIVAIDEKETGLRATLKLRFTMLEGPENGVVLLEVHYFDLGFARVSPGFTVIMSALRSSTWLM